MNIPRNQSQPFRIKPLATAIAACLALSTQLSYAATIVVDITTDGDISVNGNCTLREAIEAANTNTVIDGCIAGTGDDIINFDENLAGNKITLTVGQIDITDTAALTIDASALASGITLSGNNISRIFGVTEDQLLTLNNLTIKEGKTTGERSFPSDCSAGSTFTEGGGICTEGDLSLIDSRVSGNRTSGLFAYGGGFSVRGNVTLSNSVVFSNRAEHGSARGGGFYARGNVTLSNSAVLGNTSGGRGGGFATSGNVTLNNCSVDVNQTLSDGARGGGFFTNGAATLTNSIVTDNNTRGRDSSGGGGWADGSITLSNSTVSDNRTSGYKASGGGIHSTDITLINSTVSGNHTEAESAFGGGFYATGNTSLKSSTVSGNHTEGDHGHGGGFYAKGKVELEQSTISGNSATGLFSNGGGLFVSKLDQPVLFLNSTISDNTVAGYGSFGDGIFLKATTSGGAILLESTILSGNGMDNFLAGNAVTDGIGAVRSLFGDPGSDLNDNIENQFSNTPNLAPLADNGCAIPAGVAFTAACVQTHALLEDSIAIDNGAVGGFMFDQRGDGFTRIIGPVVDIGAFEAPLIVLGDCNISGGVDASDVSCTIDVILETGTGNADCTDDSLVNVQDVACTIDKAQ